MEVQNQLFKTLEQNQNTLRIEIANAEMEMATYDNSLGDQRFPGHKIANMMN